MPAKIGTPSSMYTEACYGIYNSVRPSELPDTLSGVFGITDQVWSDLIDLTKPKCKDRGIPVPAPGPSLAGLCIYAILVATKYLVVKNGLNNSHLVCVQKSHVGGGGSDCYFVVSNDGATSSITDITTNQLTSAPDYIVGRLSAVKGLAKKMALWDGKLYDVYALGASSNTWVL